MRFQSSTQGAAIDGLFDAVGDAEPRSILHAVHTDAVDHEDDLATLADACRPQELRDIHLPTLRDQGCITWDAETGSIAKGPNFETVASVIGLLDDYENAGPRSWP